MNCGSRDMIQKWRPSCLNRSQSPSSPCPKGYSKVTVRSRTCGFWSGGVVYQEHASPGQTIIKECHLNVLHWLRDVIWQNQPQLWATGDWQLHHENTPVHASCFMQSFSMEHQIAQVTHPHYCLYLAPWNFWLVPKLKSPLKEKRFQTINEI